MLELISSGVFILWFSIIASVATVVALELKCEGWASTFLSLAIGLVVWNHGWDIWGFVTANIGISVLFLLGYLLVGVVWSILKWNEYVKSVFRIVKKLIDKYIKSDTLNPKELEKLCEALRDKDIEVWAHHCKTLSDVINKATPEGAENKASIVAWIGYWPLSLIGTLLNNPFRRLFEYTYNLVSGIYDEISLKHRAKLIK